VVKDTRMSRMDTPSTGGGILIKPAGGGSVNAIIDGVTIDQALYGVRAEDNASVSIRNTTIHGVTGNGILAAAVSGPVKIMVEQSTIANGIGGAPSLGAIKANGLGAVVWASNTTLFANSTSGFVTSNGGQILSFGDNRTVANGNNGLPSGIVSFE
jgi:hypothetical protein